MKLAIELALCFRAVVWQSSARGVRVEAVRTAEYAISTSPPASGFATTSA